MVLVTFAVGTLVTVRFWLALIETWLFEPGPVVAIVALFDPPPPGKVIVGALALTVVLLELVFPADPLTALPPLVLLLTLAEPEEAFWLLELVTLTFGALMIVAVLLPLIVIWLFEPGPVVEIVALFDPPPPPAIVKPLPKVTTVEPLLLLFAPPETALPPLVLPLTLAVPEVAPWLFVLITTPLGVLTRVSVLLLLTLALLLDPDPVFVIVIVLAASIVPLNPKAATAGMA